MNIKKAKKLFDEKNYSESKKMASILLDQSTNDLELIELLIKNKIKLNQPYLQNLDSYIDTIIKDSNGNEQYLNSYKIKLSEIFNLNNNENLKFYSNGRIAYLLNNLDKAKEEFDKGVDIEKVKCYCLWGLSWIKNKKGKHDEAFQLLLEADKIEPVPGIKHDLATYYNIGLGTKKDLSKSMKYFKDAVNLDNDFYLSHIGIAQIHSNNGNYNDSLKAYMQTFKNGNKYELNPKSSTYHIMAPRIARALELVALKEKKIKPSHIDIFKHLIQYSSFSFNTLIKNFSSSFLYFEVTKILENLQTYAHLEEEIIKTKKTRESIETKGKLEININVSDELRNTFNSKILYEKSLKKFLEEPYLFFYLNKINLNIIPLENFFSAIRKFLLLECLNNIENICKEEKFISIFKGISKQCFENEFCWIMDAEEIECLKELRSKILLKIKEEEELENFEILILSCYENLFTFKELRELLINSDKNIAIKEVIKEHIYDFESEKKISIEIKKITPINNKISEKVRNQYEVYPYPRWASSKNDVYIKNSYAGIVEKLSFGNYESHDIKKILIAGCGTGFHAYNVALKAHDAEIHAIDLSLKSLSYGKRKCDELSIKNIKWFQADITELDHHNQKYDSIESVGVLHHIENPKNAFEILTQKLNSKGIMKIGLYSKVFRDQLKEAKALIKKEIKEIDILSIHKARQLIMDSKNKNVRLVVLGSDFFSTSSFVDLLMHEHELDYDIDDIKHFLGNEFNFLGFEFHPVHSQSIMSKYRNCFPGQNEVLIDNWDIMEQKDKNLFSGMYQFWLQKRL